MILGLGIDLVDIEVFAQRMTRTPQLARRLFTELERSGARTESLAGKFAAKEAFVKASGVTLPSWHDLELLSTESGAPNLSPAASLWSTLRERDIARLHVSISHERQLVTAVVIAEGNVTPWFRGSESGGAFRAD